MSNVEALRKTPVARRGLPHEGVEKAEVPPNHRCRTHRPGSQQASRVGKRHMRGYETLAAIYPGVLTANLPGFVRPYGERASPPHLRGVVRLQERQQ